MNPMRLTQRKKRGRPRKISREPSKRCISPKPIIEKAPAEFCSCVICADKEPFSVDLFPLLVEDMRKVARAHNVTVSQIIEAGISHLLYDTPGDISKELQEHRNDFCFRGLKGGV